MQFNSVAPISIFCKKGDWNREYMHGVQFEEDKSEKDRKSLHAAKIQPA